MCLSASGQTHRSVKELQQSLGRAADFIAHASGSRFAVFEIGMNHRGEILPLTQLVKPHARW